MSARRLTDRLTARRLFARHLDRITLLASVVGSTPEQSAQLARQGFALALRGGRPFTDALVSAFGRLATLLPEPDQARGRLLVLLVELDQRPADEAARLLDVPVSRVPELLAAAHEQSGPAYPGGRCRGWGLVSRATGLSAAEEQGRAGHLALCRHCRAQLAALDRTRTQVLAGSATVAGLVSVSQLGTGAVVAGKAATWAIGAVGAAVLATGGAAAVAHHHPTPVRRTVPAPTAASVGCADCPASARPAAAARPTETAPGAVVATSPGRAQSAPALPRVTPTPLPVLPALPTVPTLPALPSLPALPLPLPLPSLPLG